MPLISTIGEASSVFDEVHVEWKIKDFLMLSDKADDFYYSPDFMFGDGKWYMMMYPKGEKRSKVSGCIALYLMRKEPGHPKTVYFTFGIKRSKGGVEEKLSKEAKHEFSKEKGLGFGFSSFCTRSDLCNRKDIFLPNNVLTIACRIRSERSSINVAMKSLRNLLVSGDDSDVVMKVQGKEFPAHKAILRARSPVFRSMFQHDMAEKQSNEVTIEDSDPGTFQDFLVHVYSGSCEQISTENVFSLFTTADKYDMGELRVACVDYMGRNLSVASFCDVIALGVRHNEQELIEKATEFFIKNSLEIVKTAEWQIFLKENLTFGNELIIKLLSK